MKNVLFYEKSVCSKIKEDYVYIYMLLLLMWFLTFEITILDFVYIFFFAFMKAGLFCMIAYTKEPTYWMSFKNFWIFDVNHLTMKFGNSWSML